MLWESVVVTLAIGLMPHNLDAVWYYTDAVACAHGPCAHVTMVRYLSDLNISAVKFKND